VQNAVLLAFRIERFPLEHWWIQTFHCFNSPLRPPRCQTSMIVTGPQRERPNATRVSLRRFMIRDKDIGCKSALLTRGPAAGPSNPVRSGFSSADEIIDVVSTGR
jgi:hypothetical protein